MEYIKNIQIYSVCGEVYNMPMITIEQMFDDGIIGPNDRVYVNAIVNGVLHQFKLVVDIQKYLESIESYIEKDCGEKIRIINCNTDRNDYLFYELNWYNKNDGEDGFDSYSDQELIASFLPNSNRKFGYSYFRTIKDIVFYIRIVDNNSENIIWQDDKENVYFAKDLWDISNSMSVSYTLNLSDYNIFDRNEQCIFQCIRNKK